MYLVIFAAIIFLADRGIMPRIIADMYAFPYGDKVGHLLLMGALSFLVNVSISCRYIRLGSINLLLGSLLISVIATIEEITQLLSISRSFSLVDLGFSYLGIWSCGFLASRLFDKKWDIRKIHI
jgi:hypothetical protein